MKIAVESWLKAGFKANATNLNPARKRIIT